MIFLRTYSGMFRSLEANFRLNIYVYYNAAKWTRSRLHEIINKILLIYKNVIKCMNI